MGVQVDLATLTLMDREGRLHSLSPVPYWYLAPRESMANDSGIRRTPLGLGFLLHNARIGEGLVLAMSDLLDGITPRVGKAGPPGAAETLFERIRQRDYPDRPSRLRCHFLSLTRESAEARAEEWNWRRRQLEQCYLVRSGGCYHYADIRAFEECATGGGGEELAHRYWCEPDMATLPPERIELLADSALYFPGWREFPLLDPSVLANWCQHRDRQVRPPKD